MNGKKVMHWKDASLRSKIFLSTILFTLVLAAWGFCIEPGLLIQKSLHLDHWPGPPLRIAFLSDLHAGSPHITEEYIDQLIDRINAMNPDIILIGGDLVINGVLGGNAISIEKVVMHIKRLKARLGRFAVLGNHDWWNDGENIRKALEESDISVLENQASLVKVDDTFQFWLIGIGDAFTNHARTDAALAQVTSDAPQILFMHDPAALFQIKKRFFLALAGHMHGGQIFIPSIGALFTPGMAPKEWAKGWIDFDFGSLFVSAGIGTSILPVRINAPPEFVILDLK